MLGFDGRSYCSDGPMVKAVISKTDADNLITEDIIVVINVGGLITKAAIRLLVLTIQLSETTSLAIWSFEPLFRLLVLVVRSPDLIH